MQIDDFPLEPMNAWMKNLPERLQKQLTFFRELDRLKRVMRRSWHLDTSRHENDAEHSWHVSVMVMIFQEYAADRSLDFDRVVRMLLLHDIVEIDAGDTFAYDADGLANKRDREVAAADRIFGLLPSDQQNAFRTLWEEFDRLETPEAHFASLLDRLQPLFHNFFTGGKSWRENRVSREQVAERLPALKSIAPDLVALADAMLQEAVHRGDFSESFKEGS